MLLGLLAAFSRKLGVDVVRADHIEW